MPSTQIERKLAAIMFTDIAGYTALSAKDETKALKLLDTQKQILTPIIEEFNGTLHKEMGDGLLFTFPTVTDAVKCGIKIQEETKANDDLNLRIGIHEGEITLKDGDALGDDVNVASRIEAFAPSGGIAISSKVQQNISSLPEYKTKYLGQPELKGVNQEVKIYCIISHELPDVKIIKEDSERAAPSTKNIILISTLLGIICYTNIYPLLQNLLHPDSSFKSAALLAEQKLYIQNNYSENILEKLRLVKNYINANDMDNNLEAFTIVEELIIDNSQKADYYSYLGQIYFQRYQLIKRTPEKLFLESKQQFINAIELDNMNREPAVITYYYLASIYLIEGSLNEGYNMIRKAMQIDKLYPGVKDKLKEINRQRLQVLEKSS